MVMLDVFKADAFSVNSLADAVDLLPYVPSRLEELGLFRPKPVTTTSVMVEEREGNISLVPVSARGTRGTTEKKRKRNVRSFAIQHLNQHDQLLADDVQNVRAFGKETDLELASAAVNDKLEILKQNLNATKEFHRIGAINGVLLDADGTTVIFDYFDEFGIVETSVNFDFANANANLKQTCVELARIMRNKLGGTPYQGIHAICGDAWFDALVSHPSVERAYERWLDGQFLRTSQLRTGFEFGEITFENYRGQVGDVTYMPTETARFFPVGTPGLFSVAYAPADYMETVNTRGRQFYAKQERLPFDTGVLLELQSNPLFYPTRPGCLLKGTGTFPGS